MLVKFDKFLIQTSNFASRECYNSKSFYVNLLVNYHKFMQKKRENNETSRQKLT